MEPHTDEDVSPTDAPCVVSPSDQVRRVEEPEEYYESMPLGIWLMNEINDAIGGGSDFAFWSESNPDGDAYGILLTAVGGWAIIGIGAAWAVWCWMV